METTLSLAGGLLGIVVGGIGLSLVLVAIAAGFITLFAYWRAHRPLALSRFPQNPLLSPNPEHWWESEAVFNPAAFYDGTRVHLLYRALGRDGISRVGYASSGDGIHFDRLPYPVFEPRQGIGIPDARQTYGPLTYHPGLYASGGGWGGVEDPRAVAIDNRLYLTFTAFEGWDSTRIGLTSIRIPDFLRKEWRWRAPALISPPHEVHKNWVLFPEKINGKYAVLHSISPDILIDYFDSLNELDDENTYITSRFTGEGRSQHWDKRVRGAGAPPLKTPEGWLLFYHAFDPENPGVGYKVGAMLLDLHNPTKVLYRSNLPVLEPEEWYENDWKTGVVYATGAVIIGDDLFVYYGGGDKTISAARANLRDFVYKLKRNEHVALEPVTIKNHVRH